MNNYNFRKYSYDDETFAGFLQKNKDSFNIPPHIDYMPGNDAVYNSFMGDIGRSYAYPVVVMLNSIRVMIYNGQDDYVVNTAGVI